jgi:hypothetical protein
MHTMYQCQKAKLCQQNAVWSVRLAQPPWIRMGKLLDNLPRSIENSGRGIPRGETRMVWEEREWERENDQDKVLKLPRPR